MYKSVTIQETSEAYLVMVNGHVYRKTRHQSIARKEVEGPKSVRHRIVQTPTGYACQWTNKYANRWWTCSKISENAYAIFPTRAQASAFFDKNGIVEG